MSNDESMIRMEIRDLADDVPVDLETYKSLRMNSYEREYLLEFLTDEALVYVCALHLNNVHCVSRPVTYEESIVHKLFPELLTRFERKR